MIEGEAQKDDLPPHVVSLHMRPFRCAPAPMDHFFPVLTSVQVTIESAFVELWRSRCCAHFRISSTG